MIEDFQGQLVTRREILKSQIKNASGKCTRLMIILGLLPQFVVILSQIILVIYSKISKNSSYILDKEFLNIVLGIVPCMLVDILVIIIGLKITNLDIKRDIFKKVEYSKSIIPLGIIAVGGVLLLSTSIYLVYSMILQILGIEIPSPDFTFPSSMSMQVIYILYICILGPLLEEIIFRGIVLKSMKKYGEFTAIIFTSIIFAMFHLNLVQFMTPLLLGILLAFVTVKTDSLVPAIIIHMFNNTVATAITCISSYNQILSSIFSTIIVMGGVIGLVVFVNKYKSDFKLIMIEDTKISSFRKKLGYCFSNGWSIGYIIFYVVFILINFIFFNM